MMTSPPPKPAASLWSSFLWTAGIIGIVCIFYLTQKLMFPLLPQWVEESFFMYNLVITSQYIPAMAVACWAVRYIKKEESVCGYFAFRRCTGRQLGLSLLLPFLYFLVKVASIYLPDTPLDLKGVSDLKKEALERAAVILFTWPIAVFVAPLMEEVLFRGFYYRAMEQTNLGLKTSCFLNGLVFGLLHVITLEGNIFPYRIGLATSFLGAGLSWVRHKTDSIWPCIILHVGINSVGVVGLLLMMPA